MIIIILKLLVLLLTGFELLLAIRFVIDWVEVLLGGWRMQGFLKPVDQLVVNLTDPPLRWLRNYIPTIRIGQVGVDLAFFVLFVAVGIIIEMFTTLMLSIKFAG